MLEVLNKHETIIDVAEGTTATKPDMILQNRTFLQNKIDEYVQSFTIHGLTRSVKGKKIESVFWTTMLMVGLLSVFVVIYGLFKKYNSHAVYTEVKSEITDKNYFPAISFCEKTLLRQAYFSYCGYPLSHYRNKTVPTCQNFTPFKEPPNIGNMSWATEMFRITDCFSWGGKFCDNAKYFRSKVSVNSSCITWNYNGDFHDAYSHVTIGLEFHKPVTLKHEVELFVIPHDHRILEIDPTKKVEIDPDHKYEIKIDKTFIKRLPAPFPSNCTNDDHGNLFPGKYTRFSCIESHNYVDMYKTCGDVFDYHKPFIPPDIVKKYKQNKSNVIGCMIEYKQKEARNLKQCRFPCEILDLNYYSTFQTRHEKRKNNTHIFRYEVGIQLKTANEYRVMEEKQLYTLSQMACEIGGFVGLIMGMSVISLIEVVVIIILTIAKKILSVK